MTHCEIKNKIEYVCVCVCVYVCMLEYIAKSCQKTKVSLIHVPVFHSSRLEPPHNPNVCCLTLAI
jgi:hypothetical protein